MIYATPADLWEYEGKTGEPDEAYSTKATPLLRRASSLVQQAIRGAIYTADASGFPTDTLKREATEEATCAQALAWLRNDIDPYMGRAGAKVAVAAKSAGGLSVQYASYAADAQARSDLASGDVLISEPLRVLESAQLLSTKVQSSSQRAGVYPLSYALVDGATTRVVGS